MDDWEALGIDWDDFHPHAREILDKPFYWDCIDEFAPNGNDTGADVLELLREWREQNKGKTSQAFLDQLFCAWEVDVNAKEGDEFSVQTHDESVIGLAFSHLKLDGACPEWLRTKALAAIARQAETFQRKYPTWDHLDRKIASLRLMEEKIKGCPTAGPNV